MRYVLFICMTVFLILYSCVLFIDSLKSRTTSKQNEASYTQVVLSYNNFQEEKKNIFFLKAHKCASSTVQNILMRYGSANGLDFVLPNTGNYLGNPDIFNVSMIPESLRTPNGKYNIFTHHTRLNLSAAQEIMYPDTLFVTILRKPADLYESLFSFYHFEKMFQYGLSQILEDPTKLNLLNKRYLRFGLNQMSWDLGMSENDFISEEAIEDFIKFIDDSFDLVMISEYMEVSLVLLCDKLKWPLENVRFFTLNARQSSNVNKLTPIEVEMLQKLNSADTALYDFFLDKFKATIVKYGVEKMYIDVARLIYLNEDLRGKCVSQTNTKGYASTVSYDLKNNSDWLCRYSTMNELTFTQELRDQQINKLKVLNNLKQLLNDEEQIESL